MANAPGQDAEPGLIARLRETVEEHGLFAPGQTVVVGASGGPDSTALLHALAALRAEWGLTLVAAHLNHGFRGAEADEDAAYVVALCARLNVECVCERIDVPDLRRTERLSAQEAARVARHAFLRRVAAEVGAERIALGHTRDDRIETVLLNLLRGTGLEGLSAMPPMRLPIVRPLFEVSRAEVEAYCAAQKLYPRLDSSNLKTDYTRNRLRTELLPHLSAYYNARVGDAILRMSDLVSADNLYLEALAADALRQTTQMHTPERIVLNTEALMALPLAMRRRVLRQAVAAVRGHLHGLGFEMFESALQAITEGRTQEVTLPSRSAGRVHLRSDRAELSVFLEASPPVPTPWQVVLSVPGTTELPEAGFSVQATLCANAAELRALLAQSGIRSGEVPEANSALVPEPLIFRSAEITLPVLARSWQPGDRIRPRNLGGRKKLQDLFTDSRVSANARDHFPVLVDAGGSGRILAVVGLRADETALAPLSAEAGETGMGEGGFLVLRFTATVAAGGD